MKNNPFCNKDPLLDFVFSELSLGPGFVFVISIIFQILFILMLTYKNNTWKDNSIKIPKGMEHERNGHGFLRINNLYIFFLPFVNFMIFSYYENIYSCTKLLVESGIKFAEGSDDVLLTILKTFSNGYSYIPISLASVIGMTIFLIFIFTRGKIKISSKKYVKRTDWLFVNGKPRLVCILFSFTVHFLQLTIILGWIIRHLMISFLVYGKLFSPELGATLIPLHPDGMFGLAPLEEIAQTTSYVMMSLGLVLSSWILGSVSTFKGWKNAFNNIEVRLALIGFVILAPLGVVITLEPGHNLIIETKLNVMNDLSDVINENDSQIMDTIIYNESNQTLDSLWKKNETLNVIYKKISNVPNWPLSVQSAFGVLLNIFLPALITILIDVIRSKYKIR